MVVLIVSLIAILLIYFDYKKRKNIGRTILYVAIFLVAIYCLFWIMRIFRYGLLFAVVLIPIYLSLMRKKK